MLTGVTGAVPIPYKKSTLTPNLGGPDTDDDIHGGMGMEGLLELAKFVQEGGALITEGSSAALMAEYDQALASDKGHFHGIVRLRLRFDFAQHLRHDLRAPSLTDMTAKTCRSTEIRIRC